MSVHVSSGQVLLFFSRQEVWRLQSALVEFREHWSALGQRIDQILGPEDKTEEGEMESVS